MGVTGMRLQVRRSLAWKTHARTAIWVGLVFTCSAPNQAAETQSFNDAPSATAAGWTGARNHDMTLGTDFGFADSNLAGGTAAGEAGGAFPRLKFPWAYYADTDIGGTVGVTNDL